MLSEYIKSEHSFEFNALLPSFQDFVGAGVVLFTDDLDLYNAFIDPVNDPIGDEPHIGRTTFHSIRSLNFLLLPGRSASDQTDPDDLQAAIQHDGREPKK